MERFITHIGSRWPWFNRMFYRPFKGAHRGYWYRLPWNKVDASSFWRAQELGTEDTPSTV